MIASPTTKDCESLPGHPDHERTIRSYALGFWQAFKHKPLHQTLRIVRRRFRERLLYWGCDADVAQKCDAPDIVRVPRMLRPPSYHYRGYGGPWLEEHFYRAWGRGKEGATYLPVFFDSLYFHAQCHSFLPGEFAMRYRKMWRILDSLRDSTRAYFTLLGMYDFPIWEWHLFPRNVIVVAANGCGDVAIPLLKGDRPLVTRAKDIQVSFMGALGGVSNLLNVREEMNRVFADVAVFGKGDNWQDVMSRSIFSLCPRGQGATSFRIYEALSMTSIPVYIWKQHLWLPYTDELEWSSFAIVAEASQMVDVKSQILNYRPNDIQAMQARICQLYPKYFSYDGVCDYIRRKMRGVSSREAAEALTARRDRF